ncbi:MAG: sensor histidine kinase [Candidatus Latescibacteria bacterium]|nr:sensor histidine kinase [Candidatus Latescibacterota bacterium]
MSWRQHLRASGLRTKSTIFILTLALLPSLLLGLLLSDVAQRSMQQTLLRDYGELAQQCAHDITLFLNDTQQLLRMYAQIIGETLDRRERLQWTLNQMVMDASLFETVYLFDTKHHLLTTTTFDDHHIPPRVQALMNHPPAAGDLLLSSVYFSDTRIPRILMGVPVTWQNRRKGLLIAEINLFYLWNVVDRLRIGKTGFVAIYAGESSVEKGEASGGGLDRVLIAHPDKSRVLEVLSAGEASHKVITAHAEVPTVEWTVIVKQESREAYRFVHWMWLIMGSITLLVTSSALIIANQFGKPLLRAFQTLLESTARIAKGDFTHPLEVRTRDELGQMTEAFNRMMAALRDTQRLERQLVQSQKMAEVGLLVANLAHELRNPLNNIATTLMRLEHVELTKLRSGNGVQACLRKIQQNIDRSKHLISTLLEFAHPVKEPVQPVDMATLFNLLLDLLEAEIKKHRITVIREYDPILPPMLAHIELLKQAFLNILTNAVEVMPEGGILTVGLSQTGETLIVTVTDTGRGIPTETGDSVLLPFVTTKEPGEGTGLGLAIAYSNIQKHRGQLDFTSQPGQGTTFTISLPLDNSPVAQPFPTLSYTNVK